MANLTNLPARLHCWSEAQSGRRTIAIVNTVALCVAIMLLFVLGRLYGTRYYTAWGDETLFTDIAEHFASQGVLGAPSYEGNGLRMSEKTYFMPPLYPVTLSAWFHLLPPTLQNARLLSNLIAAGALVVVFLLARSIRPNSLLAGLVVIALAIDRHFASMFNWARPDIMALTLSLLAVLVYFRSFRSDRSAMSIGGFCLAWVIASCAMLTHPIGGIVSFLTIPAHIVFVAPRE
jgi:hypothetical protein